MSLPTMLICFDCSEIFRGTTAMKKFVMMLSLLLGLSLTLTSYAISASRGFVGSLPGGVSALLQVAEFALQALGMTALFYYIPNTHVHWRHALAGGVFVAVGFELAKRALGWYLVQTPAYSTIYGAFATVPIFLIWIYLGWVIVLLGAVIAAYAPSLEMRVVRRPDEPGTRFATGRACTVASLTGGASAWIGGSASVDSTFLSTAAWSSRKAMPRTLWRSRAQLPSSTARTKLRNTASPSPRASRSSSTV